MIPASIVTGASASEREAAIARALMADVLEEGRIDNGARAPAPAAVLLEGFPDGKIPDELEFLSSNNAIWIEWTAPGCLCCIGNLTLRVTLNRLLRRRPSRLYIAVADGRHLPELRRFLSAPPYDGWLRLGPELHA